MAEPRTPTGPAGRALHARLRALREQAGMSGSQLARTLGGGWQQSKVSKIETGRQMPTPEEVIAWARATGVDPDTLLALHSKAFAEFGAWRNRLDLAGGPAAFQGELAALESSCTFLAEYQPAFIPGRLQTPSYMRQMTAGDTFLEEIGIDDDELSRIIAAKVRRQSILYEPGRRIVHVVGEAALRTRIGGITRGTMREQLLHLADLAELAGHEFGVVPFDVNSPIAPTTGFDMYDRDLVIVEALAGELQITDPGAINRYARWLDELLAVALKGADAAAFCQQVRAEMN